MKMSFLCRTLAVAVTGLSAVACQAASNTGLSLELIAEGFDRPVFVAHAADGSGALYVVEQTGKIFRLLDDDRALFLDVSNLITNAGNEQGLLSLAFHPRFRENRRLFIYYTAANGDNTLASVNASTSDAADPDSLTVMFAIPDPASNHNGGTLAFGPDGYLYIGMGDGGRGGDPWNNAQNLSSMLGKIHRIDVDSGAPYSSPADNPFTGRADALPEIWAYGLRNPWRMSFDRENGDLWIGDVGQNLFEEIDRIPAGHAGGANLGWRLKEASQCYLPARDCVPQDLPLMDPVVEYDHGQGCSVTGGYVYRGERYPTLQGVYLFADYCSGVIWGATADGGIYQTTTLLSSGLQISSFGEDESGEVYVVAHNGRIYQINVKP